VADEVYKHFCQWSLVIYRMHKAKLRK